MSASASASMSEAWNIREALEKAPSCAKPVRSAAMETPGIGGGRSLAALETASRFDATVRIERRLFDRMLRHYVAPVPYSRATLFRRMYAAEPSVVKGFAKPLRAPFDSSAGTGGTRPDRLARSPAKPPPASGPHGHGGRLPHVDPERDSLEMAGGADTVRRHRSSHQGDGDGAGHRARGAQPLQFAPAFQPRRPTAGDVQLRHQLAWPSDGFALGRSRQQQLLLRRPEVVAGVGYL